MNEGYDSIYTEEERAARRESRAAARKEKEQARRRRMLLRLVPLALAAALLVFLLAAWAAQHREAPPAAEPLPAAAPVEEAAQPQPPYTAAATADTLALGDSLSSGYAVLIDQDSGTILAEKEAETRISPASMTKILTLLVAAEHITDLDNTFTVTIDITDCCYVNDCSVVGFEVGEVVPVRDLLYGTILPSGADAALSLAVYTAGSQEAFVALMNEKIDELGLSDTAHFTNCIGLYDADHYCTVLDMALILRAAMEHPLCREVLAAHTYKTVPTPEHPDGQVLSNWFLRRIEDKDAGTVEVLGAKTGYVTQSGSCAASAGLGASGKTYLCVTGDAGSSWQCIYDHAALYKAYCP